MFGSSHRGSACREAWYSSAIGARVALVGQETTLHQEMIGGGRYIFR